MLQSTAAISGKATRRPSCARRSWPPGAPAPRRRDGRSPSRAAPRGSSRRSPGPAPPRAVPSARPRRPARGPPRGRARGQGPPPRDFRLWISLHEACHRVQFAAAPWLRGY
ncbi:MAG TPA: zinc-dependent metalloprotease, partial [Actinomycetota bacterium]|nr:zinc-dependent metalloprotease [Actinomycetota bacterium]